MARPDRHRAELVAESGRLLRRKGYAATSVAEVLTSAGATNGSLYHHFPGGKEDLARATVKQAGDEILTYLQGLLAAPEGVVAAAQAWIDATIAAMRTDPRDGCPIAPTAIEAPGVSDALRTTTATAFATWEQAFADTLAQDRPLALARTQASVLLSAFEGAQLLDRTAQENHHLLALRDMVPALLSAPRG